MVLIESDWNLKQKALHCTSTQRVRINRIRLEFKVDELAKTYGCSRSVLIESDWNLK